MSLSMIFSNIREYFFNRTRSRRRDNLWLRTFATLIYAPNHFWVGAIDSSDRFKHISDPQCIRKRLEKNLTDQVLRDRPQKMVKMIIFSPYMHKSLLNRLPRAEYAHFSHTLWTDSQNLACQNVFKEFSDTLWIENVFTPIRAINCTDSEVIWNVYMFNWDLSISLPAAGTVKKYSLLGLFLAFDKWS